MMKIAHQKIKFSRPSIFLIGPMGAGKTTIGKLVAKTLRLNFYDSDYEIEKSNKKTIAEIFSLEGEKKFRCYEETMIIKLTNLPSIVLATGGGAILLKKNRNQLKNQGMVFYLQVSLEEQIKRVQFSDGWRKNETQSTKLDRLNVRPLLSVNNLYTQLSCLQLQRKFLYEEIADFTINTDLKTPQEITQSIIKLYTTTAF